MVTLPFTSLGIQSCQKKEKIENLFFGYRKLKWLSRPTYSTIKGIDSYPGSVELIKIYLCGLVSRSLAAMTFALKQHKEKHCSLSF